MNFPENDETYAVLHWLRNIESPQIRGDWPGRLSDYEPEEFGQILEMIASQWAQSPPPIPARWDLFTQLCVASLLRHRQLTSPEGCAAPILDPNVLLEIYHHSAATFQERTGSLGINELNLFARKKNACAHILQMLSAQADEQSLDILCEILRDSPPTDWHSVALGISPLFQHPPEQIEMLFDKLGDCALQASTAGPILDLANYLCRRALLPTHPLASRVESLTTLLGGLVERLGKLEENPRSFGDDLQVVYSMLSDSIALTVSVCDALGLIGNLIAETKLNQALELSHRRIQAEAAGALARLGCVRGKERLLNLVAEPVARLRALAYADELGMEAEIDEEFREPLAQAEAAMASWLAEHEHFGFPPNSLQLVDQRSQFWPSYDDPQDCHLWRFTYNLPNGVYSNIGITGPMTHAFRANLADMSVDDIYAVFAGWLVQHDEIYEIAVSNMNAAQRSETARLEKLLREKNVEQIETLALTFFFGERSILALGMRHQAKICAITDSLETILFPVGRNATSLTPELVLALYRGRKMLRTFNPARDDEQDDSNELD